jgi:hypothetical protein
MDHGCGLATHSVAYLPLWLRRDFEPPEFYVLRDEHASLKE